jgi:hypothetical protein
MALGPFTAEAASNLPSGTDAHRCRRAGPPDHVSTLSGPGICPYPASYPGRPAEARLSRPGFPLPFGHRHSLPGHPVPARELGLPCGRLTGPCCQGRTPTGLPRSARMSCGRGGCLSTPGTAVPARPAGHPRPPHAALQRPVPVPPSSNPPPEASYHEASSRVHGRSPVRPSPGL